MKFAIETVAATQQTTLAAVGVFTESVLETTERLMQLNIEVTRTAFESSAALAQECLNLYFTTDTGVIPHVFRQLGGD